jgi:hypothetical protein
VLCVYEPTQKATRIKTHDKRSADLTKRYAYASENS